MPTNRRMARAVPEPSSAPSGSVYQLRMVMHAISPLIWRRLLVPARSSLADLHAIVQVAFGWDDAHLHRFVIHGRQYGISYPGGIGFRDDARCVRLERFDLRLGERFTYEYDLTAGWRCDLRLEQILPDDGGAYPRLSGGRRAGPPEDSGGSFDDRIVLATLGSFEWPRQASRPSAAERAAEALADLITAAEEVEQAAAEAFALNRTDLRIVGLVSQDTTLSAGELARAAGLSPAATSTAIRASGRRRLPRPAGRRDRPAAGTGRPRRAGP